MASARRISVVLPVYQERDNIAACLRGLWRALSAVEHEILVVYDFDEDTTLPAIAAMPDAPPSLRLVKNEIGRGAANALRAGFAAARGDVVVTTMADLSDPPELIPALAEKVRAGAAVVAGSRYAPGGSQTGGPLLKRTLSRWAGLSLRAIAHVGTHDATSNFRAYARSFLEAVTVESTSGFQIALELTVKAHLAGLRVDEVPSSWTDRSAGESRFRLWAWMPSYLAWWLRAAAAPLTAAALLVGLLAFQWSASAGDERQRPLLLALVALAAAGACCALAAARALRGRTSWLDLAHPLVWLHPWLLTLARAEHWPAALAGSSAASLALLALGVGAGTLARGARALAARLDERALGLALVALLLWAKQLVAPEACAPTLLDASWEQAVGQALLRGMSWGRDLMFTYGPLGWFFRARYEPLLWWTNLVWWLVVYKGLLALFLTAAFARVEGAVGRTLFLAALLLPVPFLEVELYQGALAVSAWFLLSPRPSAPASALALVVLATATLVKFTSFVLVVPCVLVLALVEARRRSPLTGLALAGGFLAAQLALWSVCGQPLSAFPAWVRSSAWIAGGYGEAMSTTGSWTELAQGLALGLALAGVLSLELLRRPRTLARAGLLVILLWALYVAGKSGFVRHLRNPLLYFATVPLLPLLVPAVGRSLFGSVLKSARYACVLAGLGFYGQVQGFGTLDVLDVFQSAVHERLRELRALSRPAALEVRLREESERTRLASRLPALRERVGARSIDQWHSTQAWLFLNELRWTPRPAFQSYFAYTPQLIEANRAFYDSERAPDFVLWQSESADERLPNLEDSAAFLVLLRDYVPRLVERGMILFERRSDAPRPPVREELVLEREVRYGETVALDLPRDGLYELRLDLRTSVLGTLGTKLAKAPEIDMLVKRRSGAARAFRIVPAMIRAGVLVQPLLFGTDEWIQWLGAAEQEPAGELESFRVDVGETLASWYEPTYGMRVVRVLGVEPARRSSFLTAASFSGFAPPPVAFDCPAGVSRVRHPGLEVVLVPPPSEIVLALESGPRVVEGLFGFDPRAWRKGRTDGARFEVWLRERDGSEQRLFERSLDPRASEADRSAQRLHLELDRPREAALVLRVDPGPAGDASDDLTFWAEVRIEESGANSER